MCHTRVGLHGMNNILMLHIAESNTFLIIFRGGLSLPLYKEAPRLTERNTQSINQTQTNKNNLPPR